MGLSANQWLGILRGHLTQKGDLEIEKGSETNTLEKRNSDLKTLFESINSEMLTLGDLDAERLELEKTNPESQMYCGIKEWKLKENNMCGMGMNTNLNMGEMVASDLKLTGKELAAVAQVLNNNSDSSKTICQLVEELKGMGIDAKASEDGKSLVLNRPDGKCVKIADCNGDGTLSNADYDFSAALCKFNADLEKFNQKVGEIEQKRADVETKIQGLESQKEIVQHEADMSQSRIDELDRKLDVVDHLIEGDEISYEEALEAEKKAAEEEAKVAEEEAAEEEITCEETNNPDIPSDITDVDHQESTPVSDEIVAHSLEMQKKLLEEQSL